MQHVNGHDFLQNTGYGVLSLNIKGITSLVPLLLKLKSFNNIEEQAGALLTGYNLPGIAIGLICANKLVYAKGFGVQSAATLSPMTEYSNIQVASLSKMFTGAAIMQLQEAGRLNLDDTFLWHVPYFKMADPRYKLIAIRHLLSHTSGLPETKPASFYGGFEVWNGDDAAEQLVRSLDDGTMLRQDPGGAEYLYSDMGYCFLAALIQEVSGESFEDYQRHHILDPLLMFNSTFLRSEVKPWNLAVPHVRDTSGNPAVLGREPYARSLAACGFLYSNIVDMSHWIIAMINSGFYHKRILRPETQALLWESLYDNAWGWPGVGYNSGFWIMHYCESGIGPVRMILGAGSGPGICTHVTIYPDQGIGSIVFVNLKARPDDISYSWGICDHLAIQMLRGEL
jgi:CubicO group peptidase (beta-lactamase class C family)